MSILPIPISGPPLSPWHVPTKEKWIKRICFSRQKKIMLLPLSSTPVHICRSESASSPRLQSSDVGENTCNVTRWRSEGLVGLPSDVTPYSTATIIEPIVKESALYIGTHINFTVEFATVFSSVMTNNE